MKITERALVLLRKGMVISAEISPSAPGLKAWVGVHPFVQDGSPGGGPYEGTGEVLFSVHRFEARKSSLDAGFDVVGELVNEQNAVVASEGAVEKLVESWGGDPSHLDLPGDDYPL